MRYFYLICSLLVSFELLKDANNGCLTADAARSWPNNKGVGITSATSTPRRLTAVLRPLGTSRGGDAAPIATTLQSVFSNFRQVIYDSRRHLVAAAAARAISIFAMYPVDTIKTRMQLRQHPVVQWNRVYRGVQGSLFGQVPYGVLTFGSYEMYKSYLLQKFPTCTEKNQVFLFAVAAILGDVTGSGWLCPSEVVKQQLQGGMYSSTMEAVKGIWNKKGISGFYQGYIGGLSRDVPFRVAQLTSYEVTKNMYLRAKKKKQQNTTSTTSLNSNPVALSPIESAVCGAVAGTFSAAVTAPLDRIKTLLMTQGGNGGGVIACASKIVAEEGVSGLFAGIVPRVAYIAPSVVIFFTVYEQVQQRYLSNTN